MTSSQASRHAPDEYRQRAGALLLHRIAAPDGPQPALPAAEIEFVAELLERWLGECPTGPLSLGPESEQPLGALLDGWCSTVVHALAAEPLSVAEAAEAGGTPDADTVGELIAAMVEAGLLEPIDEDDGVRRFDPSPWLRHAMAPLSGAARLELQLPQGETMPIVPGDVGAAFLLTLPMLGPIGEELYGTCRLTVPVPGSPPELAGVVVLVEDGEIASVTTDLSYDSSNFAVGAPRDWIDTLIDPEVASVNFTGDPVFAVGLLGGLHEMLFAVEVS